jgi:hypothetical protein
LGALLGNAGPTDVNVVDPQSTVIVRVIATAHELIDSLTVDVSPTEGAPATSLAFTKEGGQANIPITSNRLDAVRVAYNATVRFRPPGWPVITQTGTLDLSKADFDIWVKPDSWITTYTVCVMLFDAQNKVIAPGSAGNNDTMTIRLDYRHPALAGPLSLVTQADSQQVINVPFPNPPGAQAPATLSMTILGVRSGVAAGPKQRALTYDETVIVVKVYVNGNIDITTNKDHTAEDSIEANVLSTMAHLM